MDMKPQRERQQARASDTADVLRVNTVVVIAPILKYDPESCFLMQRNLSAVEMCHLSPLMKVSVHEPETELLLQKGQGEGGKGRGGLG